MSNLFFENLKSLNRKERYWLLRFAMGAPFPLGDEFREQLNAALGKKPTVPDTGCYVAMDYHLDWLAAAVTANSKKKRIAEIIKSAKIRSFPNDEIPECSNPDEDPVRWINGTQQDIDFLIAFGDIGEPKVTHLVLCEAKGETNWDPAQLESKAKRLKKIFGAYSDARMQIRPHFVLIAPKTYKIPSKKREMYPSWFESGKSGIPFIQLTVGSALYRPTRIPSKGNNKHSRWEFVRTSTLNNRD